MYLATGPGTRKARNLASDPACTLSVSLPTIDLVLEGVAKRVTDGPTLERVVSARPRLRSRANVLGSYS